MRTELLHVSTAREDDRRASIAHAVELLKAGQLVAFPTDTVYGVAAVANRGDAVAGLYVAKERPPDKAVPILLADVDDIGSVVTEVSTAVRRLIARFWPGALTLILPKSNLVPTEVSSTTSVAVRIPDLSLARQIIAAVGVPLAATSANRSGRPSPCTAEEVMAQLGGRIAAIVDGGPCPGGIPSTILDCTVSPPQVVRVGAISIESLRQVTDTRW